jgi:hypothetical protein
MSHTSKIGVKHAKKTAVSTSEPMITDFGTRTISSQNFSKIVALPKTALTNCGIEYKMVNVKLVQDNGERYIKLTPICQAKEKGEEKN